MIEVTGAKGDAGGTERADRYDKLGATERRTALPLLVGLVIAAIGGYLRTAFPDLRLPKATEAAAGEPERDEGGAAPEFVRPLSAVVAQEQATPAAAEVTPRLVADGDIYGRYHSNVVPFPGRPFTLIDSPPIEFPQPGLPDVPVVSPAPDVPNGAPGGGGGGPSAPSAEAPPDPGPDRRNRAPEAGATLRLNEAVAGSVLLIGFDQLLQGASDADGDQLSISEVRVSEGSVAQTEEGLIYTSNAAAVPQTVLVTFKVTDGELTATRTALIPLVRGPILGTPGDDMLPGTTKPDQIDAGAGHDIIDGLAGNDVILGGDGNDRIVGAAGHDTIMAGRGDDVVFGGAGNDLISGGEGNDRLHGEADDDIVRGESGDDHLTGGLGDDLLFGDSGDDLLQGNDGDDVLDGGAGDDVLEDGAGADSVFGDLDDDTVIASRDAANDHFDGGEGEDTLDYSAHAASLHIDFIAGTATGAETGLDTISGFEVVMGGAGDDIFTVGGEQMRLTGGEGEDTFVFELPEDVSQPMLVHDILDFVAGDRIHVASYEFSMDEREDEEDRFERYYRDRDDDGPGELELRIRHRTDDELGELTIFEFDANGDFEFEMTVTVHGHYQPYVYDVATA